jgi:DNA-binding MarR family transcriptional regulator
MVVIDRNVYTIKTHVYVSTGDVVKPSSEWIDTDLVVYASHLGLSASHRELGPNFECPREIAGRFKVGTTTTARVLKALYLFGYLTRAQYQAADRERLLVAQAQRDAEKADVAEEEFEELLRNGLVLTRAKKIIDARIKAQKQAAKGAAKKAGDEALASCNTEAGSTLG